MTAVDQDLEIPVAEEEQVKHSMLAALIMVARHHGLHLSREQLLRAYAKSAEEVSPATLVHAAIQKGLKARRVSLTWKQLMRLGRALPAILRLRDGSALVLTGVNPGTTPPLTLVRSTAPGAPVQPIDEVALSERWDGEAILIKRDNMADADEREPFGGWWLVRQVLKEKRIFRDVGIAATILSFFALVPPLLYMVVVDRVLIYQRVSSLFVLFTGILFLLAFDTAFGWLRRRLVADGSARVDARLGTYIFDRLIGLSVDVFERLPTGLIAFKINEVWRIRNFLTGPLFTTALDSITLIVLIPVMFWLNAGLTFFVLGVAALMFLVVIIYIPSVGRAYAKVVQAEQVKNSFLVEVIHGMRTVKSLALEGGKRRDWDAKAAAAVRANQAMQDLINQPQTLLQPLEKLAYAGTLLLGSYLVLEAGQATLAGTLIAFTMIAQRTTQPIIQLANLLQQVQEVRGAVAQVASIVNLPPEDTRASYGLRPEFRGHISFDEVYFRYAGAQNYALERVSFDIPEGFMVGFMGRSGSGKTTVTRLLQGLHQDYEGLIKIDGSDLRQMDLEHLRANLGVVLQDSFLFNGTVRENIAAAKPDASFEEIIEAARMAGAEEFIERLPRGYDTVINEGSSNLSGGQRQRIAIARALLTDPSILILDEATSALDPDSEAIINNNLSRIAKGRTMVVISHRLASLVPCDQIVVMERGRVYDVGRHEDLVQRCDIYRHLWFQQNRHTSPGAPNHGLAITGPAAAD